MPSSLRLLVRFVSSRFSVIFSCNADHPWMREDGDASDKPIDFAVLTRMKQFRAMNKLKRVALKVRYFLQLLNLLIYKSGSLLSLSKIYSD